jgi:FHS family L-fucose permease-like MFS transporter
MEAIAPKPTAGSENTVAKAAGVLVPLVIALFFAWGFSTVLVDALAPKLKGLFHLSYLQAALTQFAFFAAYFFFSLPAAALLSRIGYLKSVMLGLIVAAAGCLMFAPAAQAGIFPLFLLALFILAGGITILQVSANPLMTLLGRPEKAHSRLTFAQFFNSTATFLGPYFVGSAVILKSTTVAPDFATASPARIAAYRAAEAAPVQTVYMWIAIGLIALAVVFWLMRNRASLPRADHAPGLGETAALMREPRLALAVLSIFLYVGAEVTIGTFMTNYLAQPGVLGLPDDQAHKLVAYYWGGAMIGRLVGGFILAWFRPSYVLIVFALGAATLATVSALTTGHVAGYSIIGVGLFNSIMFPTIFALGIEGQEAKTPQASGLICMAIVGGAVLPPLTGWVADATSLAAALFVPVACYVVIAGYGWLARRPVVRVDETLEPLAPPIGG